jgi:hypothetical protein
MVTNYPHPMTTQERVRSAAAGANAGGRFARVAEQLRQMFCGFRGHDTLLHFEDERMSLRCVSCGHETPGWELNQAPPTVTVRGDARRHAIVRPQLVSQRKIA